MYYKILSAQGNRGIETLETAVAGYIADGWQPQGGICAAMHQGSGTITYYQAVIREAAPVTITEPVPAPPVVETVAAVDYGEIKRRSGAKRSKGVNDAN